ncbi:MULTISPECIES: helix-turn-helix transcriptional regulator [unclassified Kitasatospora]|uniref:helix-turn-helix domain-containing protein n=1 Tax=unclassified Kitasatospora TaxID=2633591 RepID=UPI002473DA11|nr:helix-turn-helix transcriptional regulator [Kitasatospora sp. MAA19]MDH6703755.1 transcriptional regulator with XRE-family HTH domain [Kitasatospora sp. MAA19]
MALRTPTLRQRRLGTELRRMREQAGFGGSHLARLLGVTPALVTQMENGKSAVAPERLREIAAACMCANEPLIGALEAMTRERETGWWEEYSRNLTTDLLDVAAIEAHARRISTFSLTFMPGLLQTPAYAASVFARAIPPLPRSDVDLRLAFRLRRQQIIRAGGTPYTAFIHEAALRMQFSGPEALAEQLGVLIDDSESPGISVRVVPFSIESLPGPSENFVYTEGPVPELDTVQIDISFGCPLFDAPSDLASYREILVRMGSVALSEEDSRDFIRSIKKEIEGNHE